MEYAKTSNLSAVAVYLTMLLGAQAAQIGKFPHPNFSTQTPAHRVDHLGCDQICRVAIEKGRCITLNDGTLTLGVCRRKLLAQELGRDQRKIWN
jgi:hypothetical protein